MSLFAFVCGSMWECVYVCVCVLTRTADCVGVGVGVTLVLVDVCVGAVKDTLTGAQVPRRRITAIMNKTAATHTHKGYMHCI